MEDGIQTVMKRVNELTGIKESDTGLAPPALWDLAADKQTLQNEQPLQVFGSYYLTGWICLHMIPFWFSIIIRTFNQ